MNTFKSCKPWRTKGFSLHFMYLRLILRLMMLQVVSSCPRWMRMVQTLSAPSGIGRGGTLASKNLEKYSDQFHKSHSEQRDWKEE